MTMNNFGTPAANFLQARTEIIDIYQARFDATPSVVGDLVETIQLSNKAFIHNFITCFPVMRRWLGERQTKTVRMESIVGEVCPWEQTGELSREDADSNYLAPFLRTIEQFGYNAKTHPDQLLADRLNNGTNIELVYGTTSTANYDGVALFSNAHKTHNGANDGTNNFTSRALTKANLHAAIEDMRGLLAPNGQPMGIKPTHLIVPPELYMTAVELCTANLLGVTGEGSISNVMVGMLKPVELKELTSATTWFLADAARGPIAARHVLTETQQTGFLSPDDQVVFEKNKYVFGTYTADELLVGPWQFVQRNIA